MKKTTIQKTNDTVSMLGFGCMRFPTDEHGKIDREKSQPMLEKAYEQGINYFDTAYVYHNGESESFVGDVLKQYPRDSFYVATKLPMHLVKEKSDVRRYFDEAIERLQVDYIDYYLLHALNKNKFDVAEELGVYDILCELRNEGKIRHIGFSFHDDLPVFEEIIKSHPWDFCLMQLNYMDTLHQQGLTGLQRANELGIPVMIMEPLKGGKLANFHIDIQAIFKTIKPNDTNAEWAFRWAANLKGVHVILSGMSTMEVLKENLAIFDGLEPLSEKEYKAIEHVREQLEKRTIVPCTGCDYCMPCPFKVVISQMFNLRNEVAMYGSIEEAKRWYKYLESQEKAANVCTECGACVPLCPQSIDIPTELAKLRKVLES